VNTGVGCEGQILYFDAAFQLQGFAVFRRNLIFRFNIKELHGFIVIGEAILIDLIKLNEFFPWIKELFLRRQKSNQRTQFQPAFDG